METSTHPRLQRKRTADNVNECVREFQLFQQYPSMVSFPKRCNISSCKLKSESCINQQSQKTTSRSVVLVLRKEEHGLCKLQKSRIKSISGRDLGEIKLQPMSRNDVSKIVTVASSVQSKNKNSCQKNTACVPNSTISSSSSVLLCKDSEFPKHATKPSPSKKRVENQPNFSKRNNQGSPLTTLVTNRLLSQNKDNHADVKSSENEESQIIKRKIKYIKVRSTKSTKEHTGKVFQVPVNKKLTLMKLNNNCPNLYGRCNTGNMRRLESDHKHDIYINNSSGKKSVLLLKSAEHKQLAESKFPHVTREKLSSSALKSNAVKHIIKDCRQQPTEFANKNVNNVVQKMSISSSSLHPTPLVKNVDSKTTQECILNNVFSKPMQNDNCNEIQSNDGDDIHITSHNTNTSKDHHFNSVANLNGTDNSKRNVQSDMFKKPKNKVSTVSDSDSIAQQKSALYDANNSKNVECTGDVLNWNILKEAVDSVPDKELRAKALQALAACGTGSGRQIPKPSLNNMKTVHDSIVQTAVFGLIDKHNFVLVEQDIPDMQRINQITRASLYPQKRDRNISAQCNLLDSEQLFPPSPEAKLLSEVDKLVESIIVNDEQTKKISQILSCRNVTQSPTQMCNKIYKQLQMDFHTFKQFDEFGFLNIHRAVVQNRLQDVDRHIMVLQACGESIDILTQDGMTSLELAINYDVHPKIVEALLKAGAQTSPPNSTNDSTLVIASKLCSPNLSKLLNFISCVDPLKKPEQLDQLDSTGFSALHYCAQKGNKEGVSLLLRAGANVDLQDGRSGRTALFHAVENEHPDIVHELLRYGASLDIPNFAGHLVVSLMDVIKDSPFKSSLSRIMR